MCNCSEQYNINSIPVGPQGPPGPPGPAGTTPSGTSGTNLVAEVGTATFAVGTDTGFIEGQYVRITDGLVTNVMEGTITDYTGTELTVDVTYVPVTTGVAADDWTITIAGERGATGATGATGDTGATGADGATGPAGQPAYTTTTAGTSLGSDLYSLTVGSTDFMAVGQYVYIANAGYYQVSVVPTDTNVIVFDPGYADNTPGTLVGSGYSYAVNSAGVAGANGADGTDGFNYETVDGNGIPAQATAEYQFLMRNPDNTGYTFVSLAELKILLASIP